MKQAQQSILAIDGISFQIQTGEFIAIVGPSGCGKTTLLNVIAGLIPVSAGQIYLNGQPILGPDPDRAMVFQSPALMPWRTVIGNVVYGLELQGHSLKKAQMRAQALIERVGLQGFENSYPRELSGGMQQRVNLARALVVEPSVLLFDEPLSALDAQTREHMQVEIQRIWLATKNTSIYVTHQINEAIYLADQVFVMSSRPGRIKEIIPVPFPRPRALKLKRQYQFIELENKIWDLLSSEPV